MSQHEHSRHGQSPQSSRRQFLRWSGTVAAASALVDVTTVRVHAGEDNTIRLALIGCGGRGSGAAVNAMDAPGGPVMLYAMADVFENRLTASHRAISDRYPDRVDVPSERRFVGLDSYRHAIDCLRPGDIAILAGYAGWRPVQLEHAVAKGVHVFMEKSFATDPPAVRRIIQAGEEAEKKNLKIAAGLMCRHSKNRQELIKRIRDGAIGQIQEIRAYRMEPVGPLGPRPPEENELAWQIRNFVRFYWVSGGLMAEMDIHQIDEICWLKDSWPISRTGSRGGPRAARIAARTWTRSRSNGPLPTAPMLTTWCATCPIATTSLPPTCTAPNAPRSFPAMSTQAPCTRTRISAARRTTSTARARGKGHSVASRVERAVGRHSQRSAAQRGQARGPVQPGGHHGARCRAHGPDRHVGPGHELELSVVP